MLELIKSALRKPISVVVVILGIVFFSFLSITRIPVDIFPELNLPTIYIVQTYGGMAPEEMDAFMATKYQDHFLYVSGIKNVEIKTIQGLCLMRLEFYPGTDMAQSAAEVANNVSRAKAYMPEGTIPPQVIRFDASSVPVGQLVFESETSTLGEIQDVANSRIRPMFSKIEGVSSPPPLGGNQRSIIIKIDPSLIRSYQLTPEDVIKAVVANNQPSPAGVVRIGDKTLMTPVNSLISKPEDFLNIPVRLGSGPTVFIRDIGTVEDAADITVSYGLVNGRRAVYIPVVKKTDASTLTVVKNIKAALPTLKNALPEDMTLSYQFDQSGYVINALKNLIIEGALGALLTGLMVLLFLRDWRSVIIVVTTIPLSILSSVILLNLFGQTINIMTLSGLALAIGILVDETTVTIENIHQHLENGKPKRVAIWEGCKEIALPKLLILISILAVFAPSFIMTGIPKSLFLPLSLSVGFAMIASFLLSQTFVPVLSNWLLKDRAGSDHKVNPNSGFEKFRNKYINFLTKQLNVIGLSTLLYFLITITIIICSFLFIGTDILPQGNSRQFQIRMRAPDGTRVEITERLTLKLLDVISSVADSGNIAASSGFVGTVPTTYGTSNIFVFNSGPHESVMQVAFTRESSIQMSDFKERLRQRVKEELPEIQISFEPMELVDRIMSQGSSNPIEVTVASKDIEEAAVYGEKIMKHLETIPGLRDVQIAQPMNYPILNVTIDRVKAGQLGLTSTQISRSLVAATWSSRFTDKNFWLDNSKGLAYQVQVQIPVTEMKSIEDIGNIPLVNGQLRPVLADVATFSMETAPGQYDRSGPNRLVTITANFHDTDLGSISKKVKEKLNSTGPLPRGMVVEFKGQSQLLEETLSSLQTGLIIAIIIIFLFLTANFQSFRLAAVILSALPAVIAGALVMLLICGATLNLQSYMGLIMSVGVSVANAILLVTNAESIRLQTNDAKKSAIQAARNRIRPILMTSIAMIAGMLPIATGLGEGADQVAPLGQAVIGGLLASTFAALFILPGVFTLLQRKVSVDSISLHPEDTEAGKDQNAN